jgi:hypothetical protein
MPRRNKTTALCVEPGQAPPEAYSVSLSSTQEAALLVMEQHTADLHNSPFDKPSWLGQPSAQCNQSDWL